MVKQMRLLITYFFIVLALFFVDRAMAEVTISASPMDLLDENGVPIEGVSKSTSREKLMEKASKQGNGVYRGQSNITITVTGQGVEPPVVEPPVEPVACGDGFTGFEPNCVPVVVEPISCTLPQVNVNDVCETTVQTCQDAGFDTTNGDLSGCMNNPQPPMGHMGNMPHVDTSKNITPAVGSAEMLIRNTDTGEEQVNNSQFANGGEFREPCAVSHMNNDDFIIYPNQQGAAHHHTYFGNTTAKYNSDPMALSATGTSTCSGGIANNSAYWVPSMIDTETNTPLKPIDILVYYKTSDSDKVVVPPLGLRMIANYANVSDSPATPDRDPWMSNKRFMCNDANGDGSYQHIIACPQGSVLSYDVAFPTCWDGVNLDSPDHKSHVVYQKDHNFACPATHPHILPNINFIVKYRVTSPNGTQFYRLSSDNYVGGEGGYSLHGDWVNGWDMAVLTTFVNNCLKAGKDCHAELLGNGVPSQRLFQRNPAEPWTMSWEAVPLR
jgi:hypothetical protein